MATVVKIGPVDHGRPMSLEEFEGGDYEEGFKYELIDGRLYVSPQPDLPENQIEEWVRDELKEYARRRPEVINYVSSKARVFVPGREAATTPEPDVAAFRDFPRTRPKREIKWEDVTPILIIEVLYGADPDKDLVRNVELYGQVPSVKEYWVLDARDDPDRPSLRVYRRSGRGWRILNFNSGETYTTRLLPGFRLLIDPSR